MNKLSYVNFLFYYFPHFFYSFEAKSFELNHVIYFGLSDLPSNIRKMLSNVAFVLKISCP